jgi:hypothetical protein
VLVNARQSIHSCCAQFLQTLGDMRKCWLKSSGMWCCVTGWEVCNISKDLNDFKTSETTHPVTNHHVQKYLNLEQHCCNNLRSCKCICRRGGGRQKRLSHATGCSGQYYRNSCNTYLEMQQSLQISLFVKRKLIQPFCCYSPKKCIHSSSLTIFHFPIFKNDF